MFKKGLAIVALAGVLMVVTAGTAFGSQPPAGWTPRVSTMINVFIGGNPTIQQIADIDDALAQLSNATGVWYRDAATTTQIPQFATIDTIPAPLEIWVGPRELSDLLQIDGIADWGYTHWTPSGHAAIALLDTTPQLYFHALVLHELMLARHIPEQVDRGGLLGHVIPLLNSYPAQDLEMLATSHI